MDNVSLFGVIILGMDIFAIVRIVQSSADTVRKILWIMGVLIFPVLGMIVWYLAGPGGKNA
jgi:hypothetical protein